MNLDPQRRPVNPDLSPPRFLERNPTMPLAPHQQRVIQEKQALDENVTRLSQFIGTHPQFELLDKEEQERMKEQCEIMREYSEILGKRIKAFPQSPPDEGDSIKQEDTR